MMKILFGVDDWIRHYEEENKCQLEDFIGKTCGDTKDILSYINRDSLNDDYIFS